MLQINIQQNGDTREITKLIRRLLWSSFMYAATYLKKLSEVFKTKLKRIKLNTDGIQFIAKGILLIFRILWYHMTSRKRTTRKRTTLCFPSLQEPFPCFGNVQKCGLDHFTSTDTLTGYSDHKWFGHFLLKLRLLCITTYTLGILGYSGHLWLGYRSFLIFC